MTLRERIVTSIRSAIVNGQLKPGTRIAEPELAERFGISRTPIREAFRQLESEGFITVIPRKGAIVAFFSAQDVSNFYDLKMILEGYAARMATMTLTDRRFGERVARAANVAVFVPGPRRATLRLLSRDRAIEAGRAVSVSLSVANSGTETWAEQGQLIGAPATVPAAIRETRLVARWILLDGPTDAVPPAPVELRAVALAPGRRTTVNVEIGAPGTAGVWALVVDVVDDVAGSFAALGSAPAVQVFEVLAPRSIGEVE